MTARRSAALISANAGVGIVLAALLQALGVRLAVAEKLPAGCGKYHYYECATEGKASLSDFPEKTIYRWHRSR